MTNTSTKPIIQICFSLKTGLTIDDIKTKMILLKDKLDEIYGENNYETHSCHLSKQLCLNKGFRTEVPDLFEEIFGTNYVCELNSETDFDKAMKNINIYRMKLSKKAERLAILTSETATNVALELDLFTQHRVIII